eukprot:TRINITY_DN92044_c0_g1_i1.p1 TRINITY_DN92044_c0_g1~~TRINITY_DN92044_c0_g1_i1.p1  ORF type:complete len:599 (+),score=114.94 TRINITY_DN92044_c0_g1_i1:31-1797(+)
MAPAVEATAQPACTSSSDLPRPPETERIKSGTEGQETERQKDVSQEVFPSLYKSLQKLSTTHRLWQMRWFELGASRLMYWHRRCPVCEAPKGVFELAEVGSVAVVQRMILIHFVATQQTGTRGHPREVLKLRCNSVEEAANWASELRGRVEVVLRSLAPQRWEICKLLSQEVKPRKNLLVSTVAVEQKSLSCFQRLLDHSFICKRTKDRGKRDLPLRLEVQAVQRVENLPAWLRYSEAITRIRDSRAALADTGLDPEVLTASVDGISDLEALDTRVNEHFLFHGTKIESLMAIAEGSFRMELAGSHKGTLYGKAVYGAECCSKADEYCHASDDGLCGMLLCRVALGKIYVDKEKSPDASALANLCEQDYDSVCGDRWSAVDTFREFVIYNADQIYPAYIITYKRTYEADILHAVNSPDAARSDPTTSLVPYAARIAHTHPDDIVRYRISLLLANHASSVVPLMMTCLQSEQRSMRKLAVVTLQKLAELTASEGCGYAKNCMQSSQLITKEDLQKMDASASTSPVTAAIPVLEACLRDAEDDIREAAAVALSKIGAPRKLSGMEFDDVGEPLAAKPDFSKIASAVLGRA